MGWEIELLKITAPAVIGFFVGRFQTSFGDRVSRNKDIQGELLKVIRLCTTSAINYHSRAVPADQLVVQSIHLKNQLWRIRTDLLLVETSCSVQPNSLLLIYMDMFDAITQYPFEATELPAEIERHRLMHITTTGETLASNVAKAHPKLF